ncbi:ATP-binding protein [Paenibacillus sp. GCM10023252]|uniref:ATP-binding protein n=1 Tax=Paenibacillus sp. GCM10023252 TaxID=3252649 RepID=UPI003614AAE3
MNLSKHVNKLLQPRTFAFQMLSAMLIVSLIPLVLLSVVAGQTVNKQLAHFNELNTALIEKNFIHMYVANIEEQARAINTELRLIEDAVLLAKAMAESIFTYESKSDIPPLSFTYDSGKMRYIERVQDGKGVVSIRTASQLVPPTPQQAYDFARSKALYPLFESETTRNPNIVSMYYIHPQSGAFYYPEYRGSNENSHPRPTYSLTSYNFYSDALGIKPRVNQVAWTKPYLDITPRGWMFTATTPVYDENQVLRGVVAADVTINQFVNNVLDMHFDDGTGLALLLNTDQELIAAQQHPDYQLSQLNLAELFDPGTKDSYRRLTLDGEEKVVFSRSIGTTNWTLGYIIPESRLLEPIQSANLALVTETREKLILLLSVLGLVALLLSILLALYLRSKVARPVHLLTGAFAEMGAGQFTTSLHDTRTLEFNQLLSSFNRMAGKIRELVEQQSELNQQLEKKVERRTEDLRDMNTELQLKVEDLLRLEHWRQELFMYISHDLKTPITLIRGYIEAINDGTIPEKDITLYLRRIYEDIQTINQFVRNLNELSLLETRQLSSEFHHVDSYTFYSDTVLKWDAYLKLERRPFFTSVPDKAASHTGDEARQSTSSCFLGDPHLIRRIIDNLMDNALKYSDPGCPIRYEYECKGETVEFRVIDEGSGLSIEDMAYVFQSFYRVDKSRNSGIPGSGLGLSIAKEIADMHNGQLTVRRNEERGTGCIFTLTLPLLSAETAIAQSNLNS